MLTSLTYIYLRLEYEARAVGERLAALAHDEDGGVVEILLYTAIMILLVIFVGGAFYAISEEVRATIENAMRCLQDWQSCLAEFSNRPGGTQ